MKTDRYTHLKELFVEAIELDTDERRVFIETIGVDDKSLAEQLRELVEADKSPEHPGAAPDTIPERIDRYAIESVLGVGGMGIVYKAQQERPSRAVALKVMRAELATKTMLRRFEAEADVLGRLRHPGVAQIFEADTWDHDGISTPFFAMEYVDGAPITTYADDHDLSIEDRLRLLRDVYRAVEAAHRMGVIHRDLKPDNILVDADGRPKVLDFGVARAVGDDQHRTIRTDPGMLVGTLAYMSPEQVAGPGATVDTRSDVYALGVIGYELLSSKRPFNLRATSIADAALTIRDREAPTLGSTDRMLRGDIETIIAKALRKEPDDRYQSAADLADDIDRYLKREPIEARKATTWYFCRQFARRNKALVGVTLAAVGLLVVTTVVAMAMAIEATHQQRLAEAETQKLQGANAFNAAIWESLDMRQAIVGDSGVRDVLVADVLDDGAAQLVNTYQDQPLVQAEFHHLLALGFGALDQIEEKFHQTEAALALRVEHLGESHSDTIRSMVEHAGSHGQLRQIEECLRLSRKAVELARTRQPDDPEILILALNRLVDRLFNQREDVECEAIATEAVDLARKTLAPADDSRTAALNNLAFLLIRFERHEEAESLLREVLAERRDQMGDLAMPTMVAKDRLTNALRPLGKLDEAIECLEDYYHGSRALFGDDSSMAEYGRGKLAMLLSDVERYDEAIGLHEESVVWHEIRHGRDHFGTVVSRGNLATVLVRGGKLDRAEPLLRELLTWYQENRATDHRGTARIRLLLGRTLRERGNAGSAEPLLADAVASWAQAYGEHSTFTSAARIQYAFCLVDLLRFDDAEAQLQACLAANLVPNGKPVSAEDLAAAFVLLYEAWGKPEMADQWRPRTVGNDA